ncbi:IS110 family transposase [Roseovarius sp. S4756]|uniref:IS110 family transposase n=1 Tax=Roseovarius maritimus TaxID=3342637 RepID=UPI003726FB60
MTKPKQSGAFSGHRFPPEIIAYAVWAYHRFSMSFRDFEDLLTARGVVVSYETIRAWVPKFGLQYAKAIRRDRPKVADKCHLDEGVLPIIDASRDWLDGFCLPDQKRFRHPNTAEGHNALIAMIWQIPRQVKVGFEATGGHEWVLWTELAAAGIVAAQLSPAQIKAFALSRGTRAKTDRIDAELIARFMAFRPDVGRDLPAANLRILRTLTTRRRQLVDMRKRLKAQIGARRKQGVSAETEGMDHD